MRLLSLFFVSIFFFSSCDEETNSTDVVIFKGITTTDFQGVVISADPDDWKLYEHWINKESALFNEKYVNVCDTINNQYAAISFPNPCNGAFILHFDKPDSCRLAYRLVDKNFKVLRTNDSVYADLLYINLLSDSLPAGIVRMYYKFYGQGCELRGHGDIQIE